MRSGSLIAEAESPKIGTVAMTVTNRMYSDCRGRVTIPRSGKMSN